MARMPRYFVPDQPQHIIQRGNNRGPIFASEEDNRFYLECLYDAADKQSLAIHAYVLMTNHVHLLATPQNETSIIKTLQSVGRRYVQYFDYHYSRPGTLWEDHHKATVIDRTHCLFTCSRHIELSPVRAGKVGHPTAHLAAMQSNFISKPGDFTDSVNMPATRSIRSCAPNCVSLRAITEL